MGRFRVEAPLGHGGMGTVYKAWDTVLERSVALKAVRLEAGESQAHVDRFRREALALAQLNHPHVCQVHDWLEWQGRSYIAMEFVDGQTLALAAETMDLREKLGALRAIASALEAAHGKGVVHRDLKPSNIMVDTQGRVKVLDFGVARLMNDEGPDGPTPASGSHILHPLGSDGGSDLTSLDSGEALEQATVRPLPQDSGPSLYSHECLTQEGTFLGSPAYASPEQMLGRKVAPPSDIFSLGVLAWKLLLGDHPFPGEGRARMEATVDGKRKSLRKRKISPRLASLLRAMLARDPAHRPKAGDVVRALDRQLAPGNTAWWVALGASLALVLGLGYLFLGRGILADLDKGRPPRLVVMPIRNETGDPALGPLVEVGMTDLMGAALRETPKLSLVDSESMGRAFATFRIDPAHASDPARQAPVIRALGAALVFRGTFRRDSAHQSYVFSYALQEPSGKVRLSGTVSAPAGTDFTPYAFVNPVASHVLHKVDPFRSASLQSTAASPDVFARYAAGKALLIQGDFKGGEPLLQEAASKAPAFPMAVAAYAACLRRLGREKAEDVANWALMSARAAGDRWAEGQALGVKAFLAKDRGDLDAAEQLRKNTLTLAQALHTPDGEALALNHLGLIAMDRGRIEEAKSYFDQSLRLSQQIAEQNYVSLAQNNLANLAMKQGDLARATEMYTGSLAVQREIGNRWGEAIALNNLGVVALTARNLPLAQSHLAKALAIRESVGDKAGQATSLRNLGILSLMKGDLAQSEAYHARGLRMAQEAGNKPVEAECSFCMGELHRLKKQFALAMGEYRRTLDLLPRQVTPEVRAGAQAALAECEARLPRPNLARAAQILREIEAAFADSPYVHRALAWLHHQGGRPSQALEELDKAQADPRHQAPDIQGELAGTRILFQRRAAP